MVFSSTNKYLLFLLITAATVTLGFQIMLYQKILLLST
jgi:hypothetical protein